MAHTNLTIAEVHEWPKGQDRPGYGGDNTVLEVIEGPATALLPSVGDIILLDRHGTGDSEEQACVMGVATPFRVLAREFMYGVRGPAYRMDPTNPKPIHLTKVWIHVRRVEDYALEQK